MSCANTRGDPIMCCKRSNIAKQCSATATTAYSVDFHDHKFKLARSMHTKKRIVSLATKKLHHRQISPGTGPRAPGSTSNWSNFERQLCSPSVLIYIRHLGLTKQALKDSTSEHGTFCSGCLRSLLTVLCLHCSLVEFHQVARRQI